MTELLSTEPTHNAQATSPGLDAIRNWFGSKGWQPFPFQEEAWAAYRAGTDGLIHAPTGTGKSYAAWLGPLSVWIDEHPDPKKMDASSPATSSAMANTAARTGE